MGEMSAAFSCTPYLSILVWGVLRILCFLRFFCSDSDYSDSYSDFGFCSDSCSGSGFCSDSAGFGSDCSDYDPF